MDKRKHIVLIVPRGEAVRNFLYSDTIKVLHDHARITILSVVDEPEYVNQFRKYADEIIPLKEIKERQRLHALRQFLHDAHYTWLKSESGINYLSRKRQKAKQAGKGLTHRIKEISWSLFANRPMLHRLTKLENRLTYEWRPDDYYISLFRELKPDLIFNTSHIHGLAGELPAKIARKMGIPVAGFVFSWDNLTSRSRINAIFDYYFVWNNNIKKELLRQYNFLASEQVFALGTPQFDYHFKPEYFLSREELAEKIGFDPSRPYILYTTGIAHHVINEHLHVEYIIKTVKELQLPGNPQIIIRTYVKGTGAEMWAIRDRNIPDVYFPKVEWDEVLYTPSVNDLSIYSSMIKHCALGINVSSTVTLELFIFEKPTIVIGFDPPESKIDPLDTMTRFIKFEHIAPVIKSGGAMVAHSNDDIRKFIQEAFSEPGKHLPEQKKLLEWMFHGTLDGKAGERIGNKLLELAEAK